MEAIEQRRVLHGHTGPETAYVVDGYPYGFRQRCRIRYWVDTAEQGAKRGHQRFVSQTTNPRVAGEPWNKPKRANYCLMVVMYLDGENHVQWTGVSGLGVTPAQDARWRMSGVYAQLTGDQRRLYDHLLAGSQRYRPPWDEWEEKVGAVAASIAETGIEPVVENGVWVLADGRQRYVADAMPLLVACARQRLNIHDPGHEGGGGRE